MNDNLQKIEEFFKCNLAVKKILVSCQPPQEQSPQSNVEYQVDYVTTKYADKLYYSLRDIKIYIIRMLELYNTFNQQIFNNFDTKKNNILKIFEVYEKELIKCGYNMNKLEKFYKVVFCQMREELVKEVGQKCVGYYLYGGVSLTKAESINELLHIIHATATNNEYLYENMPKLKEKTNYEGYPINLYGTDNELAKKIYEEYPKDLLGGQTDILGMNNKILMMIRDRGHALSIEIQEDNNHIFVNYFIPKICNVEMVNNLKGVKKITPKDRYTVGVFETTKENLSKEIIDFISKVPTDEDMILNNYYSTQKSR